MARASGHTEVSYISAISKDAAFLLPVPMQEMTGTTPLQALTSATFDVTVSIQSRTRSYFEKSKAVCAVKKKSNSPTFIRGFISLSRRAHTATFFSPRVELSAIICLFKLLCSTISLSTSAI